MTECDSNIELLPNQTIIEQEREQKILWDKSYRCFRMIEILKSFGKELGLTHFQIDQTVELFTSILFSEREVKNYQRLMMTCLYYIIRNERLPIRFKRIFEIEMKYYSIPTKLRYIRRDLGIFSEFDVKQIVFKYTEYFPNIIDKITNDPICVERLKRKCKNVWTIDEYRAKLSHAALEVARKKVKNAKGSKINTALAVIYKADKLITENIKAMPILTQKIISSITGCPEYGIRDAYYRTFYNKMKVR